MRKTFAALTICATIGLFLGGYNLLRRTDRAELCEYRTFDYLSFLDLVRKESGQTSIIMAETSKTQEPFSQLKLKYLETKIELLKRMIPLVEKQVELHGSTYGCVDDGYKLLMSEISIPTFSSMSRQQEIEWLWKKMEKRQEVSITRVLEIVLGPLVALIVGILGFMKTKKPSDQAMEPTAASEQATKQKPV